MALTSADGYGWPFERCYCDAMNGFSGAGVAKSGNTVRNRYGNVLTNNTALYPSSPLDLSLATLLYAPSVSNTRSMAMKCDRLLRFFGEVLTA